MGSAPLPARIERLSLARVLTAGAVLSLLGHEDLSSQITAAATTLFHALGTRRRSGVGHGRVGVGAGIPDHGLGRLLASASGAYLGATPDRVLDHDDLDRLAAECGYLAAALGAALGVSPDLTGFVVMVDPGAQGTGELVLVPATDQEREEARFRRLLGEALKERR